MVPARAAEKREPRATGPLAFRMRALLLDGGLRGPYQESCGLQTADDLDLTGSHRGLLASF
jgi:hypothetical protein